MPISLLSTKFYLPATPAGWVRRARLVKKLDEVLLPGKKMLLLSAPPGYGKTTLLGDWLATCSAERVAWLSLDPADNDAARFALYLIHALGRAFPGLGESMAYALQSPQPPPLEVVMETLINEIAAQDAPLLLALDDFHLLKAQPVHEAMAFLLDHLPPKMRLVLLSRADPPLPLARLRARGQLVELRASDLRFTPAEAADFLNQVMGLGLPAPDVDLLETRTEGWIAGLQLAALALQGALAQQRRPDAAAFIQAFSGSHVYILDYLTEEVLDRQPAEVRSFLLRTCVLDRLTGDLCDCLAAEACVEPEEGKPASSQAMLEALARANLFVIPLDAGWFRYHHLFADLLRAQLHRSNPNRIPELHRRASRWFAGRGLTGEAIQHALAAGDTPYAADLVEAWGLNMLMEGEMITLHGWLLALPEDLIHARPRLGVYNAWIALLTGRLDKIEPALRPAESVLAAPPAEYPPTDLDFTAGQIAAIRAYSASLFGQAAPAIAYAQDALRRLPAGEGQIRSVVSYVLGGAHLLSGQMEEAAAALAAAGKLGRASGNLHMAVPATCALAGLQFIQGRITQAAQTLEEALEMARLPDGRITPLAARVYSSFSDLAYERDELPESLRCAEEGIALARQWGNMEVLAKNYLAQARALLALGRFDESEAALEQSERILRQHMASPGQSSFAAYWRVRLWLARPGAGLAQAARWLEQRGLSPESQPTMLDEHDYLAAARVLRGLGHPEEAARFAERVVESTQAGGRLGRAIEALALLAALRVDLGQPEAARDPLRQALRLTAPEGFARSIIDAGPAVRAPLATLRADPEVRPLHAYLDRLLAALPPAPADSAPAASAPAASAPLVEPLSERELEVLRLVAAGYSNADIAERLVIALSTVKRHLNHILDKLDATSRTQAVARARDLRLI